MTTDEQAALREMTDVEIRRAQSIVAAQIPAAHAQRNTDALATLQGWADDYAAEMMRRVSARA
jgi:hypothetical protein